MVKKILTQKLKLSEIKVSWKDLQQEVIENILKSPAVPYRKAGDIPFVRKFYVQDKITSKGLPEGQIRHYISTMALDRDHEIMMPKGVKLKNYKKNPMVLWSHNPSDPENVIGKNIEIEHTDKGLVALTQFSLKRSKPAMIYDLYKEGLLRMWSVGFIPLTGYKPDKKEIGKLLISIGAPPKPGEISFIHKTWELLEYSACAVPSNPEAATLEVAKGYDLSDGLIEELGLNLEKINRLKAKLGGKEDDKTIINLGAMKKDDKKEEELEKEKTDEDKTPAEVKGAIPYRDHGAADEGTAWDGPAEVRAADVDVLKIICAWYDSGNADKKASYKLPHHRASDKKAIWRGVSAAMGALLGARGGVAIPGGDRKSVYNHLKSHYKHWDKDPPDFKEYSEEELKGMFPVIKAKYNCECIECGHKMASDKHCADIKCPKCGGEMRRVERPGPGRYNEDEGEKIGNEEVSKPLPNEHSCRLVDPAKFEKGSFRSYSRTSDGKKYRVIAGRLKGKTTMTEQGFRYPKDDWTSAQANKHCKDHDGIRFIPAKESVIVTNELKEMLENLADIKEEVMGLKSGRVISAKNRKLLVDCREKMGAATEALTALLKETELAEEPERAVEGEEELNLNFRLGNLKRSDEETSNLKRQTEEVGDKNDEVINVANVIEEEEAKKIAKKIAKEAIEKIDLKKIMQEKLDFLKGKVQ